MEVVVTSRTSNSSTPEELLFMCMGKELKIAKVTGNPAFPNLEIFSLLGK